jgi:hypothetical protein
MGGNNSAQNYANQQLAMISQYLKPYQTALSLPTLQNIIQNGGQGGAVLPMNTAVSMARNNAATAGLNAQEAIQRQANQRIGASVGSGIADGNVAAFQDQNDQNIAAAGTQAAGQQQQLQLQNFSTALSPLTSIINTLFGGYSSTGTAGVNNSNYNWLTGSGGLLGGLSGMASAATTKYSDRRLKSNIDVVGKVGPLRLYEYDIDGHRERGVMAQEARTLFPEAVAQDQHGTLMVNYKRLLDLVKHNA